MFYIIKKRLKRLFKKKGQNQFKGSKIYWENRYVNKGNSGAGSYGILAEYKAGFLNEFVKKNKIKSISELGCGDGNQLKLSSYPKYFGYDVSERAVKICKKLFKDDSSKQFYTLEDNNIMHSDLVLSLDVIYHLVEDDVFVNHMKQLFESSTKYVIIYASNYDKYIAKHVKSRKFTDWIDENLGDEWILSEKIINPHAYNEEQPNITSMSDFYVYKKIEAV